MIGDEGDIGRDRRCKTPGPGRAFRRRTAVPASGPRQRRAAPTARPAAACRRGRKQILLPYALADVPTGIGENQICRPKELAQIEPDRPARYQTAVDCGQIKRGPFGMKQLAFKPGGEKSRRCTKGEKGEKRRHVVPPRQPPALPPKDHQQGRGQGRRNSLAQKSQYEQGQRRAVKPRLPAPVEPQIDDRGA